MTNLLSVKILVLWKRFTQEYGIDYEETFSHVARITSICTLLAFTVTHQWKLPQMDVKNALLNCDLEEEVCTCIPPGYTC